MPHRARRKTGSSLLETPYCLCNMIAMGLSMYFSPHTHSSPFDPNSMILYYTLYNSSFPHDKSKFFILNSHNKTYTVRIVESYINKNPTNRLAGDAYNSRSY